MADYRTIYYSSYYNNEGRKTTILIKKKDYTGNSFELTLGDDPLFIRMIEDDSIAEPIKGTEATLNVYSDTINKYSDIYLSKERTYQMFIFHGESDDEIVKNRSFWGGIEDYAITSNFIAYKNSAQVANLLSDAQLVQTIQFPAAGDYVVRLKYAEATENEIIQIHYNSVLISEQQTFLPFGTIIANLTITEGILNKTLFINKTWDGAPTQSDLCIKEISILPIGQTEHDYQLLWCGYINPAVITEPYLEEGYIFQLRAYCGLGNLSNIDFRPTSTSFFHGAELLIKIINDSLHFSGIYLPLKTRINLYESVLMQDGIDPLVGLYTNLERFRNKDSDDDSEAWTCQDTIAEILRIFGARIYQMNGFWNIERIVVKKDITNQFIYDQFANQIEEVEDVNDVIDYDDVFFINKNEYLSSQETWRKFKVIQNLGYRNSIIHGDFNSNFWINSTTPEFWSVYGGISVSNIGSELAFNALVTGVVPNWTKLIEYNQQDLLQSFWGDRINMTDQPEGIRRMLQVKLNCRFEPDAGFVRYEIMVDIKIKMIPVGIGSPVWLYYDETNHYYSWTANESYISVSCFDNEISIETEPLIYGYYHILVHVANPHQKYSAPYLTQGKTFISNFRIRKSTFSDNDSKLKFRNYDNEINQLNQLKAEDITVYFGETNQLQYLGGGKVCLNSMNGILFSERSKYLTAKNWGEWGAGHNRYELILDFLCDFYKYQFSKPRIKLTANILGDNLFEKILNKTIAARNVFLINLGGEYNDYYNVFSGSWCEIGYATGTDYFGEGDFDENDFEPVEFFTIEEE